MRRFPRGVALIAAAALACVVLGPASARTPAPAKYGGTLVVGLSTGDADTLDPTVSRSGSSQTIYLAMCQKLYDCDARQQLVPVLAAAVPVLSKDKLSYTVQLRKGVEFNDGTPFNAQAVVTTVQRFMTYPGSIRASDYAAVDSVTASGPYTVVFHLKARDSTFIGNPYVLSPTQLAKLGANFGTNPVCVGPFMFDHRVVGDNVTVIKSPYYYDQKDVYLDKIVYKPMPDAPAAAAALKAGDIQALDQGLDDGARRRAADLEPAGDPGAPARLAGHHHQHRQQERRRQPAVHERGHAARLEREAAAGLRGGDRPQHAQQGRLRRPLPSQLHPDRTGEHRLVRRDEGPLHAVQPQGREEARRRVGLPEPDRAPADANTTDKLRLAQFIQAQEAAVGINVVIDSFDLATRLARARSGNFNTCLAASSRRRPTPTASSTSGSRPRG